jgi:cobalamin biosynthesis protein CobD/CbiB
MALELFLIWYFVMGFLLGNGVPHFAFGAAGKIFRSPFGQRSSPKKNILWGLSNFIGATVIAFGLIILNLYSSYALIALLLGFWLMMLMFGTRIKTFLSNEEAIQPPTKKG